MSAIAAVIARDGAPAEPLWLAPMFAAAPHRGGERRQFVSGHAALGCQHAPGTPGRSAVSRLHDLAITFYGRVDNRIDLWTTLRTLGVPHGPSSDDASLVLSAFVAWQEGCAARLVGDFAFVIYDGTRRRAYAARDALGVKPLYYHVSGSRLVLATEMGQVHASGVRRAPCQPMLAELLAFDVCSRHETIYEGVSRLPGGHWMTVTDREIRVVRYWAPDPYAELRLAHDEDYAEQFRDLFRRAVADRMEPGGTTAAYLSGGLDSSSVVCMARALERPLETFSMVFPEMPEADERPYIDAVTARTALRGHQIPCAVLDPAGYVREAAARADLPELPGDAFGRPLLAAIRARGLTAALTGAAGDYGFTGSFFHYADRLQDGDLVGLLRQMVHDARTDDVGWSWSTLASCGLRLLVPPSARRAVRPAVRALGWGTRVPRWIDPAFARRTGLLERLSAPREPGPPALPSRAHVCGLFDSGWTARLLESGDRAAAEQGIDLRHPFLDRRLVEFAIALPESQRWRGQTTKFVMREGMRELLPETVYARTGKADGSAFVPRAVEALGGEAALRDLRIADLGWVDADALRAEYRSARAQFARQDDGYCAGMYHVWMALAVERWYRSIFVEGRTDGRTERPGAGAGRGEPGARAGARGLAHAVSHAGAR